MLRGTTNRTKYGSTSGTVGSHDAGAREERANDLTIKTKQELQERCESPEHRNVATEQETGA